MKFSWQILNYFINLETVTKKEFIKKLALTGFEVEETEINDEKLNKIIFLDITANRKDINCIFNLAEEISIIFNIPFKIPIIKYLSFIKDAIYINKNFNNIQYIYINTIHRVCNSISPDWLQNHLACYDIKSLSLLNDIQEYIKIKWGYHIVILDIDELGIKNIRYDLINIFVDKNCNTILLYQDKQLINLNQIDYNSHQLLNNNTKNIFLFSFASYNISNHLVKTFFNAYQETIRLIVTFGYGVINRPYKILYPSLSQKSIKIKYKLIQKILGPISSNNYKLMSYNQIVKSLNQLNLDYNYYSKYKVYDLIVPHYRNNDLQRPIDIIEEIARIYGFQNFLNLSKSIIKIKKGKISNKLYYLKVIRNILRSVGLNEVINTSLVKRQINNQFQISIYNFFSLDSQFLRTNIINNLIDNHIYNIRQKNHRTEIFEIGKIFYKNFNNQYIEETYLNGLIYNPSFIQKDWSDSSVSHTLFHIKGILEIFFNRLNAKVKFGTLIVDESNQYIKSLNIFIHKYKTIAFYNYYTNELIGFLTELNKKYLYDIPENNHSVYLFDININNLLKTIYLKKHFKHTINKYSLYPSVTRDVSLKITKSINIDSIVKLILENNHDYLESIHIISEYYDAKLNTKSVCFRIVYRSHVKTLNSEDIKIIDMKIKKILQ